MTEQVQKNSSKQQEAQTRSERLQQIMQENENYQSEISNDQSLILKEIFKNAKLGMISIEILKQFSEDRGFRNLLMRQYTEYNAICKEVEIYSAKNNVDLKTNTIVNRIMMFMGTLFTTITDKSNSKLSEIMIQGINMGIISIKKVQNSLSDNNNHNEYADRLMGILQNNLEDLKLFL
jgi:formyltetrahydrofolate synthetase